MTTPDDNPRKSRQVVGMKYEPGEGLPRVILKGTGRLADAILNEREMLGGPPVVRDDKLVTELLRLPTDAEIGPELYELVANLLVHVFAVEEKLKQRGEI